MGKVFFVATEISAWKIHLFLSHLSTSGYVFGFVASLVACVCRVKTLFMSSKQSPAGSLGHVVQGREALLSSCRVVSLDELLETLVVDPRPPLAFNLELKGKTGVEGVRSSDPGFVCRWLQASETEHKAAKTETAPPLIQVQTN